jgi:HEPN domain-containing protein
LLHYNYFSQLAVNIFVYDSAQTVLLNPGPSEIAILERHIVEGIWSRWYGLALNFFKCAVDSLGYKRPDLTAFMLHQAVEHTCSALIRVFTGYRPNTHNLTRLMMMVESFTNEMTKVFPRVTREEEEIYSILQRGYLDARYKDDYDIPSSTLNLLIERVERLQITAASLYAERLSLHSQPEFSSPSLTLPGSPALP